MAQRPHMGPQQTCDLRVCVSDSGDNQADSVVGTSEYSSRSFPNTPSSRALIFEFLVFLVVHQTEAQRQETVEWEGGSQLSLWISVFSAQHTRSIHTFGRGRGTWSHWSGEGVCGLKKSLHTSDSQHHRVRPQSDFP